MFKDIFITESEKGIMKKRIEMEIDKKAQTILNPDQSDLDFNKNLHDLCVLNLMRESHEK